MLDVAVAYNRYKFIGNEFLTWLWFNADANPKYFNEIDETITGLYIGNRVVLENTINDAIEIITIKGDDAGLEEGLLSLRKGAVVIEINLICKSQDQEWQFTLKGESLSFYTLKVPETGPVESKDDMEGIILEKTYLYEKVTVLIDNLFNRFLKERCSNKWDNRIVPEIRKWIQS
jgi:hypothetical protein